MRKFWPLLILIAGCGSPAFQDGDTVRQRITNKRGIVTRYYGPLDMFGESYTIEWEDGSREPFVEPALLKRVPCSDEFER